MIDRTIARPTLIVALLACPMRETCGQCRAADRLAQADQTRPGGA